MRALFVTICFMTWSVQAQCPASAQDAQGWSAVTLDVVSDTEEGSIAVSAWNDRLKARLGPAENEDFAMLENWCRIALHERPVQIDGEWRIDLLMAGLVSYLRTAQIDEVWQQNWEKLLKWNKKHLASECAPIASAQFWRTYAFDARGHGSASTVSKENWATFYDRVAISEEILERYSSLARVNPQWFAQRLQNKLWTVSDHQAFFLEYVASLQNFPLYFRYGVITALKFDSRYGGSNAQLETFVRAANTNLFEKVGNRTYATIYLEFTKGDSRADVLRNTSADWNLMKSGFRDLLAAFPRSNWNPNVFASFACQMDDALAYIEFRQRLKRRDQIYLSAWQRGTPITECDRRFNIKDLVLQ